MSDAKSRRGRPVGTGIDDRSRLQSVAALIAANPSLKPTTAIKSTGINDPSAIRRLRDKFNLMRSELMSDLNGSGAAANNVKSIDAPAAPAASAQPGPRPAPSARTVSLRRAAAFKASSASRTGALLAVSKSAPAALATIEPELARSPREVPCAVSLPDPTRLLLSWYSFGLRTASAAIGAQLAVLERASRLPHVSIALRQQLAFGELAMALCAPTPLPRHTVH